MDPASLALVLCLLVPAGEGQNVTVDYTPGLAAYDLAGRVTSDTAVLQTPQCVFDNTSCPLCDVWLVSALNASISTFDTDQTNSSILTLSPYPSAFASSSSRNYFLTRVAGRADLCSQPPALNFFQVGSEGSCSTTNCNGFLPVGSTVRFKYLLVDSMDSSPIRAESRWSDDVSLYSLKDPAAIDDSLAGRSAAMIVITAVLSVALGLLLLLLMAMLILAFCWADRKPVPVVGSLRVPQYSTHNLKNPEVHVNPSYEQEGKN
ncbi:uroplakin-3b [Denticeps clupeoides]|uniref:Uncharacterized protein n=1 Tax=Denticeps clupeoides TaxID=299321 RepID=A0AAY4DG08_9TELE|nr:uroplakin-3b [Denticeps clupeoides]